MLIKMRYYGAFGEKTGKATDVIQTQSNNLYELYRELKTMYSFDLDAEEILIAVNNEYQYDLNYVLAANDIVALLPPMSGG